MHFSLSTLIWDSGKYGLERTLEEISSTGCRLIDLAAFEGWQGISPAKIKTDTDYRDFCSNVIKKYHMQIDSCNCGFSCQITDSDETHFIKAENEFSAMCEWLEEFHVRNITVNPGSPLAGEEDEVTFDRFLKRILRWARIAKRYHYFLSVECHQGSILEKPQVIEKAMEQLFPEVGITLDPSHLWMQGYSIDLISSLMPYTEHVHVRYCKKGSMQCRKKDNTFNIGLFIKKLIESNYKGNIAIEFFNDDIDPEEAIELYHTLIQRQ